MDSAVLRNLHHAATALAHAVDRANARVNAGHRDADRDELVLLCIDLERTFEKLARAVPAGDPDHRAVVEACEIYRLVVRRLVMSAGLSDGERSARDGPRKVGPAAHARRRQTATAPATFGRHARGRRAAADARCARSRGRPSTLRGHGPVARRTERTTLRRGDGLADLLEMAALAVRDSRRRVDAIETAARDTREAARRTAARVEESARILETVSVALYRAG